MHMVKKIQIQPRPILHLYACFFPFPSPVHDANCPELVLGSEPFGDPPVTTPDPTAPAGFTAGLVTLFWGTTCGAGALPFPIPPAFALAAVTGYGWYRIGPG